MLLALLNSSIFIFASFLNWTKSSILFSYRSICVYNDSICSFNSWLFLLPFSRVIFNLSICFSSCSIFSFNSSLVIIFSSRFQFKSSKLSFILIISAAKFSDIDFFLKFSFDSKFNILKLLISSFELFSEYILLNLFLDAVTLSIRLFTPNFPNDLKVLNLSS